MYSSNNFSKFDSVFYEWNTEINSALHLLIPIYVNVMVFIVFIYRYSSQRISVRGFYFCSCYYHLVQLMLFHSSKNAEIYMN